MKALLATSAILAWEANISWAGQNSSSNLESKTEMHLRVLTLNVWGIPWVTPSRGDRIHAVAEEVSKLKVDLVAIQEVWVDEDAKVLADGFASIGLRHCRRFERGKYGNSGLMVMSRFPIQNSSFYAYSQGQHPGIPWHLDWVAGKGLALVEVQTPLGHLGFATTHLQSGYGTRDYLAVQISQAVEAGDWLSRQPKEYNAMPVVLGGDLNSKWNGLPFRVLSLGSGLYPVDPRSGIDTVMYKSGSFISVTPVSQKEVLLHSVSLRDGSTQRLSDHPGVLAVLKLEKVRSDQNIAELQTGELWPDLMRRIVPVLHSELELRETNLVRDRCCALVLMLVGAMVFLRRRSQRLRLRGTVFASVSVFPLGGWFLYLALSYGPAHLDGVQQLLKKVHQEQRAERVARFTKKIVDSANMEAPCVPTASGPSSCLTLTNAASTNP